MGYEHLRDPKTLPDSRVVLMLSCSLDSGNGGQEYMIRLEIPYSAYDFTLEFCKPSSERDNMKLQIHFTAFTCVCMN